MKVVVYESVEVSDGDRALIAERLGQKKVTREEMKEYLWEHGKNWQATLTGAPDPAGDAQPDFVEDESNVNGVGDEDLLGADDGMDLI